MSTVLIPTGLCNQKARVMPQWLATLVMGRVVPQWLATVVRDRVMSGGLATIARESGGLAAVMRDLEGRVRVKSRSLAIVVKATGLLHWATV